MDLLVSMPQHRDPVPLRGRVAWISSGGPKGPGIGIELQTGTSATSNAEDQINRTGLARLAVARR
jgi:Tfp pilus assembly protein PilZ